jgi:hypothetical protein
MIRSKAGVPGRELRKQLLLVREERTGRAEGRRRQREQAEPEVEPRHGLPVADVDETLQDPADDHELQPDGGGRRELEQTRREEMPPPGFPHQSQRFETQPRDAADLRRAIRRRLQVEHGRLGSRPPRRRSTDGRGVLAHAASRP